MPLDEHVLREEWCAEGQCDYVLCRSREGSTDHNSLLCSGRTAGERFWAPWVGLGFFSTGKVPFRRLVQPYPKRPCITAALTYPGLAPLSSRHFSPESPMDPRPPPSPSPAADEHPPSWPQQPATSAQYPYVPSTPYTDTPFTPPRPGTPTGPTDTPRSYVDLPLSPLHGSYIHLPLSLPPVDPAPSPLDAFSVDSTGYPNNPQGTPWTPWATPPPSPYFAPGTAFNAFQQPIPGGYPLHPAAAAAAANPWGMPGMGGLGYGMPPYMTLAAPVDLHYNSDCLKEMQFAEGEYYGPVLEPFLSRVVQATITINPLILYHSNAEGDDFLKWNMTFHSTTFFRTIDPQRSWEEGSNEPATHPRLTHLTLISHAFPWTIVIQASNKRVGVTCSDVLDSISEMMCESAGKADYECLPRNKKRAVLQAYEHNRSRAPNVPGGALGESLRKLDWLCRETNFGGIQQNDFVVKEIMGEIMPCVFELKCLQTHPEMAEEVRERTAEDEEAVRNTARAEQSQRATGTADEDDDSNIDIPGALRSIIARSFVDDDLIMNAAAALPPAPAPPPADLDAVGMDHGFDCLKQMQFAEGEHYGPVIEPFFSRVVHATITINPLISCISTAAGNDYLKWNMILRPSTCFRTSDPQRSWMKGRNEPATHPRLTYFTLISRTFPWIVVIQARNKRVGVTCGDVLDVIAEIMYESVDRAEYEGLPPDKQLVISEAFEHNRSHAPNVPGVALGDDFRKLDWLCRDTNFGGLQQNDDCVRELVGDILPCIFELKCLRAYPETAEEARERKAREEQAERDASGANRPADQDDDSIMNMPAALRSTIARHFLSARKDPSTRRNHADENMEADSIPRSGFVARFTARLRRNQSLSGGDDEDSTPRPGIVARFTSLLRRNQPPSTTDGEDSTPRSGIVARFTSRLRRNQPPSTKDGKHRRGLQRAMELVSVARSKNRVVAARDLDAPREDRRGRLQDDDVSTSSEDSSPEADHADPPHANVGEDPVGGCATHENAREAERDHRAPYRRDELPNSLHDSHSFKDTSFFCLCIPLCG